jgi:hypothetical protein
MSAPADTAAQLNIKTPKGTLINLYATNVAELGELIEALEEQAAKIAGIESLFTAAGNVADAGIVAPPSQQPAPQAAAPQAPAPGNVPLCEHGEPCRVIPAGVSKATGKPYRSFAACARPREAQCNTRVTL